jgi:hypothetical protein
MMKNKSENGIKRFGAAAAKLEIKKAVHDIMSFSIIN